MKSIFSYRDLNLLELEKNIQEELVADKTNKYFDLPDLSIVAIFGDLNKAKYLLSNKDIDVNEKDKFNSTALCNTCYYFGYSHNNYKVIQLLLDNDANINFKCRNGKSLLFSLCDTYLFNNFKNQNNKLKFIFAFKILLNYGANINDQDEHGYTILMKAVYRNRIDLTRILLDEKMNIYIKDNDGENIFDKIRAYRYRDTFEIINKMLIKYKYNDAIFYLFEYTNINIFFNKN